MRPITDKFHSLYQNQEVKHSYALARPHTLGITIENI